MATLPADVSGIEHHAPGKPALDTKLEIVTGRQFAGPVRCIQLQRCKQDVVRVYVSGIPIQKLRIETIRRVANQVEDTVAVITVVVYPGPGSGDERLLAGYSPTDAQGATPLRSGGGLQILIRASVPRKNACKGLGGV